MNVGKYPNNFKCIKKEKLIEMINDLPADAVYISPNDVGNLSILDDNFYPIGFIDLNGEEEIVTNG
jgi:hypothetical protein